MPLTTIPDPSAAENAAVAAEITRRKNAGVDAVSATNLAIRQHAANKGIDPVTAHIQLIAQGAILASTFNRF